MNSVFKFDGKVAFVTGGASGIGRATALAFAQAGDRADACAMPSAPPVRTSRSPRLPARARSPEIAGRCGLSR